jgi:hypothetical protein
MVLLNPKPQLLWNLNR